jgi:DNA-binding SARP family transcriptional activator
MEFRVLGPIEALADGGRVALGAPKQRALLAVLLLNGNEVLARERLIDDLWGEEPPRSAVQSLQVYVHGLRQALGSDRIETHGTDYRFPLGRDELDLERFERLVERAGDELASGNADDAAETLRSALGLWRGSPLADLGSEPVAERERPRLYRSSSCASSARTRRLPLPSRRNRARFGSRDHRRRSSAGNSRSPR